MAEYCTERVIVPSPINRIHYEFEKPVKETKISNRKHYEIYQLSYCNYDLAI